MNQKKREYIVGAETEVIFKEVIDYLCKEGVAPSAMRIQLESAKNGRDIFARFVIELCNSGELSCAEALIRKYGKILGFLFRLDPFDEEYHELFDESGGYIRDALNKYIEEKKRMQVLRENCIPQ